VIRSATLVYLVTAQESRGKYGESEHEWTLSRFSAFNNKLSGYTRAEKSRSIYTTFITPPLWCNTMSTVQSLSYFLLISNNQSCLYNITAPFYFSFSCFFSTQVARALVRPVYTFVIKVVFIWLSIRICYAALLWQFNRPSYKRFLIPPPLNNMRSLHVGDEDPRNNWCPSGATVLNTREDKSLGLFGKKLCNKSLIKNRLFSRCSINFNELLKPESPGLYFLFQARLAFL
jgi:hypothetical protein